VSRSALLVGSSGSWYLRLSTSRFKNSFGSSRLLIPEVEDELELDSLEPVLDWVEEVLGSLA
jgi:hypothetical protein